MVADNIPGGTAGWRLRAESDVERRLWTIVLVSRLLGLGAAAVAIAAFPQFGRGRWWAAAVIAGIVVPYDIWLHRQTRRRDEIHPSAGLHSLAPGALAFALPEIWFLAVGGALANVALFAVTFRLRPAIGLGVVSGAALALAGLVGDAPGYVAGLTAYAVGAVPLVISAHALYDALATSERRYEDFLEYANDMIYTHSLDDLRFLSANEAALELTGYDRTELDELTVDRIVAPEHFEQAAQMIQRKVEGVTDATTHELDILAKDGRRIAVEVSTRVIYRRGEAVAVQGIARDISERRSVEAEREALDRARSEFIANAAHELRTPLTTLSGLASVLASTRAEMTEEELGEALEALTRQGRRVRTLADKLLDLSILELGNATIHREVVDVVGIAERALEDVPPPASTTVSVAVDAEVKALADPVRLQEIFHNLLANAYRYGGQHVTMSGITVNEHVLVDVSDDGPGVPGDLATRLFEPFTHGGHGDSTGLGLTICRTLAEAQGGALGYETIEPHGARFTVRLPAAP